MLRRFRGWPGLLGLVMVFVLMAGVMGLVGVDKAYASTTSFELYVDDVKVADVDDNFIGGLDSFGIYHYSATNTAGVDKYYTGQGATVADIVYWATYDEELGTGLTVDDILEITITGSDGGSATFEGDDLFDTVRYYFPPGSEQGDPVEPIIATASANFITNEPNELDTTNTLRFFFGQVDPDEQTNGKLIKWVSRIDITTE
jgi:hypothetical protein